MTALGKKQCHWKKWKLTRTRKTKHQTASYNFHWRLSPRFTTRGLHSETCLLGLETHFPIYIEKKLWSFYFIWLIISTQTGSYTLLMGCTHMNRVLTNLNQTKPVSLSNTTKHKKIPEKPTVRAGYKLRTTTLYTHILSNNTLSSYSSNLLVLVKKHSQRIAW